MRRILMIVTLSLALGAGGCLIEETEHTLYLEPDGSLTWSVLQREVRSESDDATTRDREERVFVLDVSTGRHEAARLLDEFGAWRVDSVWLRESRPYSVMTDGRFEGVERALGALLEQLCERSEARIHHENQDLRLELACGTPEEPIADDSGFPLSDLTDDLRLVLAEGRFKDARGFDVDGDVAVWRLDEAEPDGEGLLRWRLVWSPVAE